MKKLNVKLTACLVSLFVSAILLILGSVLKNNYCLCFGLFFAGFAIICYSYTEYVKLQEKERVLKEELNDVDNENYLYTAQTLKTIKKQRKTIIWGGFAFALLIIFLGIACVI